MQLHIAKAFEVIDAYLPYPYVDKVRKIIDRSPGTIKNVRCAREGNIKVIEALLKVALENKKEMEKAGATLQKLINQ